MSAIATLLAMASALLGAISEGLARLLTPRRPGCEQRSIAQWLISWVNSAALRFKHLRRPGSKITLWVVAAFGLAQIAKANDKPFGFWPRSTGRWVFSILAAVTTLASLLIVLGYRGLLKRRSDHDRLQDAANGVRTVVEKNTSLAHEEFGVNIWLVRGPRGLRQLLREVISVTRKRETSPIVWTKRKGVIGTCWAENRRVVVDIAELQRTCTTEADWCRRSRAERFRFGWREFDDTRRYKGIVAKPLRATVWGLHRVRGVLAVDLLVDRKLPEVEGVLESQDISDIIRTCEGILSKGVDE